MWFQNEISGQFGVRSASHWAQQHASDLRRRSCSLFRMVLGDFGVCGCCCWLITICILSTGSALAVQDETEGCMLCSQMTLCHNMCQPLKPGCLLICPGIRATCVQSGDSNGSRLHWSIPICSYLQGVLSKGSSPSSLQSSLSSTSSPLDSSPTPLPHDDGAQLDTRIGSSPSPTSQKKTLHLQNDIPAPVQFWCLVFGVLLLVTLFLVIIGVLLFRHHGRWRRKRFRYVWVVNPTIASQ